MAKLNVQGLARRDIGLMSAILPDEGCTVVSCDLSAGEPTCTAHYSQDKNYYDATFGMVGKAPYYTDDGLLKIGDIYLTVMSVSPVAADLLRAVYEDLYDGETFAERWLKDSDFFTKGILKKSRALHKIKALGISYSMGPKKIVKAARDAGFEISLKDAKAFYAAYWALFAGVRAFGARLERLFKQKGYLVNDFGYRLIPDADYKCLNYFIQSSVSGIMHVLCEKYFSLCDFAQFITIIHDEVIMQIPNDKLAEAKELMKHAEESLNQDLAWSVRIRVGWAEGKNWYEAK